MSRERGAPGYRVLSHTADTGVEAESASLASLIELLARGMCELMAEGSYEESPRRITFSVSSSTIEDLVVDTLSELLYQSEAEDVVFADIEVELSDDGLTAAVRAMGRPTSSAHVTGPPVKAVTYHGLEIRQDADTWYGRVYFDV